ncbi:MAG TPA: hypothetical protein VII55_02255 [Candidatus Saccharimonadales bacterium]
MSGREFAVAQPARFDAANYLTHSVARTNFILVEIGHDELPIAYRQATFTGQRAAVEFDAWLRDPDYKKRRHLDELEAQYALRAQDPKDPYQKQNIAFVEQILAPENDPSSTHRPLKRYGGTYDPTTILPDGAADEVFLGNVFGDPHIAHSDGRTRSLLDEANRLMAADGVVVIRETIDPLNAVGGLTDAMLERSGLQTAAHLTPQSCEWRQLEPLYDGGETEPCPGPEAFYQFLTKIAAA